MKAAKNSVGFLDFQQKFEVAVVLSLDVFEHQISYLLLLRIVMLPVVSLRLGGGEARLKKGPSDDVIILSQP